MAADFKQGTNLAGGTLACDQVSAAAITTVYTVPALSATKIATCIIHNASGSTLTSVAVNVHPSGGTSTRVALVQNLAAGDSVEVFELKGAFLEAGALIRLTPSAVTAANYFITGAVSS